MKKESLLLPKSKKGGVVTNTVIGVGLLIVGVIIMYVVVDTILNAGLLGTGTINVSNASDYTTQAKLRFSAGNFSGNFSSGVDNIAGKVPTILLIVAVVFLFGALVLLVRQARDMGFGSGSGGAGGL